jgi:putative membrane protein
LDAEHKALKDSLVAMTGEKFDALYVQSQIRDHQKAIALFQKQATEGQKQELKAYAQKLLPKIKMHLQHVQDMSKKK